jgi:glycosidase
VLGINEGFGEHIHSILKRWMDPYGDGKLKDGIDGWRLDVAEKIDLKFWRQFRIWVKEINPEAYITGEILWDKWQTNEMFNAAPWLQGDAFDGVMNYRFAYAVDKFIADVKNQISPTAFADSIKMIMQEYPKDNFYAVQNLFDSHDVDRIGSQIVNPDRWYDHEANPQQNKDYKVRKPDGTELLKQKLAVGIQMSMPGAPMIYYGDEAGMWGGDDPDCRKPMIWSGLKYETETADPLGRERKPDSVYFNQDLFNWYKKLIAIRKENKVLSEGELFFENMLGNSKILIYRRTSENKSVYIVLNNNDASKSIQIRPESLDRSRKDLTDLIGGGQVKVSGDYYKIDLQPYQIMMLR